MKKGQAFLVVGHASWGKSETLLEFTGNRRRKTLIKGVVVNIIRRSNDDDPKNLYDRALKSTPETMKFLLIAFCPNFATPKAKTLLILRLLQKKYKLYFFVIKKCYKRDEQISPPEIKALRNYGVVEVLKKRIRNTQRAKRLDHFIFKHIRP